MQPSCDICEHRATCFANYQVERIIEKVARRKTSSPSALVREHGGRLKRPLAKMCKYYDGGDDHAEG